jgi:hypothetical protein
MLNKAWRSLRTRLGGAPRRPLKLMVHRAPMYPSFWEPLVLPDGQSGLLVQVHIEASNNTDRSYRIAGAELSGLTARQTTIGVRDPKTRSFAADNPLPARQIATVSLQFLIDAAPAPPEAPFRATLALTDNLGATHSTQVILH